MAYRNGTYVAFHANGNNIPGQSDITHYYMLKAWAGKDDDSFTFINSHDKTSAVRDSSKKETLARSLRERLDNSKNMVLLLGATTKLDTDWVPYEISYAVDTCRIPIIVVYLNQTGPIRNPSALKSFWPKALEERIENNTASCIHIPYKKDIVHAAINQFSHNSLPNGRGLGYYDDEVYRRFGIY